VNCIVVSGGSLFSGYDHGLVKQWDLDSEQCVHRCTCVNKTSGQLFNIGSLVANSAFLFALDYAGCVFMIMRDDPQFGPQVIFDSNCVGSVHLGTKLALDGSSVFVAKPKELEVLMLGWYPVLKPTKIFACDVPDRRSCEVNSVAVNADFLLAIVTTAVVFKWSISAGDLLATFDVCRASGHGDGGLLQASGQHMFVGYTSAQEIGVFSVWDGARLRPEEDAFQGHTESLRAINVG